MAHENALNFCYLSCHVPGPSMIIPRNVTTEKRIFFFYMLYKEIFVILYFLDISFCNTAFIISYI